MKIQKKSFLLVFFLFLLISPLQSSDPELFAILVDTSKYWFNSRQATNILLIYHKLKEYGVSDKNVRKNSIFNEFLLKNS